MQKENIMNLGFEELQQLMEEWGESGYRFKQVTDWLYTKRVRSFEQMSNISKKLRDRLNARFSIPSLKIKDILESIDGSVKFLYVLGDGMSVEGVYMPDENKRTCAIL